MDPFADRWRLWNDKTLSRDKVEGNRLFEGLQIFKFKDWVRYEVIW